MKILKGILTILWIAISHFSIGQSSEPSHNHDNINYAEMEDEFAHIAPTHIKKESRVLDAYGVKLLMKSPKKKIWHGRYYDEETKALYVGYKFNEDTPEMTGDWNWKPINQLEEMSDMVDMKKYGGILWLFGLEQIVNHVIVLPIDKPSNSQVKVKDVYVFMFNNPQSFNKFQQFKAIDKNEDGYQKMFLHEGRIHFPTGG